MSTEVLMPEIGETVVSGTIVKWLKDVGDEIEVDESLVEIETDKANVEIPAPAAGVLAKKAAEEGDEVEVGDLLAIIADPGEAVEDEPSTKEKEAKKPKKKEAPGKEARAAKEEPEEKEAEEEEAEEEEAEEEEPSPEEEEAEEEAEEAEEAKKEGKPEKKKEKAKAEKGAEPESESAAERRRMRSSPLVRRMAREHGIDLEEVEGSGLDGRVTKEDMLDHIAAREGKKKPLGPTPSAKSEEVPSRAAERAPEELEEVIPLEGMRKAIADHMVRSKQTSPHVTTINEADMSAVVALREKSKEDFQHKHGIKLTYLPFFILAAIRALKEFPYVNSSLKDDEIILKRYYNIGVSVQTERGLMTPVIRDADRLDIEGLAKALDSLARRAREGRLGLKEIQGGTFSITSPGSYGAILSTPIINQPQAAILGVERIQKRAVVIDDAIAIRPMVYLCLSYDHRIIDGATSIRFLQRICELIGEGDFEVDVCL